MISKIQTKYIKSLFNKKERNENQTFLVEWKKSLIEVLNSDFIIELLAISQEFFDENQNLIWNNKYQIVDKYDITKISTLSTNIHWIAVVKQKQNLELKHNKNELILVLDNIKDPWNLWTIIRIADFYWIKKIITSLDTCEVYNPKVISSTMWSFTRVDLFYTDLCEYLKNQTLPIYGSFMDWENIKNIAFDKNCFLIIWNESSWISQDLNQFITKKITINKLWNAESLNAWVACWIIIDNIIN